MPTNNISITSAFTLSNSPHRIPCLGFGVYQSLPPTCVNSCLNALNAGYRHIDTAQYYANETSVGRAVREAKIPRSEIFITTKILSPSNGLESTYKMIEESVKKLDGENGYVDLFVIHSPNGGAESRRLMWFALEQAKEAGKVRDIGVSNYGKGHIEEIKSYGKTWPPAVNQIEVCTSATRFPFQPSYVNLTFGGCSFIPGVNSGKLSNTAPQTLSSLKHTVPWSATRNAMKRLLLALRRSTNALRIKCLCDTVCRKGGFHYQRVIHQVELHLTQMCLDLS